MAAALSPSVAKTTGEKQKPIFRVRCGALLLLQLRSDHCSRRLAHFLDTYFWADDLLSFRTHPHVVKKYEKGTLFRCDYDGSRGRTGSHLCTCGTNCVACLRQSQLGSYNTT